ncbi:trk system potassium uptake protein TrkA [Oceanobacillus limi]|uniref:Trk system potassium uptake protein TrkA n=1 Tax=Oceanobacillus limi TaxID=930131 RepID=A0A1I0C480_9BACI|nr:TrkA family potassium uptake protein [Oceanobacillus limi]SET14300.1 trk system potassium uptake protein TrkA [Oceanobacillus limi]
MKKQFVIIGLGSFGSSVCKRLFQLGHDVLAIDNDIETVKEISDYASHAVVANATDEDELKSLGVRNFDHAIVAIGEKIQPSILCTLILKEIGVKKVYVKAQNLKHQRVLEKIGADRIIHPEEEMGIRIANQLDSDKIIDYIGLSKNYSIIELEATNKVSNHSLVDLDVRAKYGCTILAIKREEHVNVSPLPDDKIVQGDILVVMGDNKSLKRFEEKGL